MLLVARVAQSTPLQMFGSGGVSPAMGAAGVATAGQTTDASIVGQARDESGAVLPGVTVTATSPALQVGSATTVTDERGEYRLTPLPIGLYVVTYELSGFQGIRN